MAISGAAVQAIYTTKGTPANGISDSIAINFGVSPTAGNYLMVFHACRGNSLAFTPPGDVQVIQEDTNGDIGGYVAWKKADGTEVDFTSSVVGSSVVNNNLTVLEFDGTEVELNSVRASNKNVTNRQTSVTSVSSSNVSVPEEGGIVIAAVMALRYSDWFPGGSWGSSFAAQVDASPAATSRAGVFVATRVYNPGGSSVSTTLSTTATGGFVIGFAVVFGEEVPAGVRIIRRLHSVDLS